VEKTLSELTTDDSPRQMTADRIRWLAKNRENGKMKRIAFGSNERVVSGASFSQHDRQLPGFEHLAMPLLDSLYNFARWLVPNPSDAEDLVQETYLKGLRGFPSFQPDTNLRAWMFQILKNTFLSSCSKLERRMTVTMDSEEAEEELAIEYETPDSVLVTRSDFESVQHAIANLPTTFREVLLLCDVEEMSYKEIAGVLSIPIGTVMSRLARARRAVRESLRRNPGTDSYQGSSKARS
jgi:RNA polymerase sigma factor (sigma-70 family)